MDEDVAAMDPGGVEIVVLPRVPEPGLRDRIHEALRAEGLVGVVYPFSDDSEVVGWVLVDEASRALRATADDVESGLELATIAARISRAFDAAVLLDTCELPVLPPGTDAAGEVQVVPAGIDPEAHWEARRSAGSEERVRVIALVPVAASRLVRRLPGLAFDMRSRTIVVPDGAGSIVVTESLRTVGWWSAVMPIVRLIEADEGTDIEVLVHTRWRGAERAWGMVWAEWPRGIQLDEHAPATELQNRLILPALYLEPDRQLVERLGWGAHTLDALRALADDPRAELPVLAEAIGGSPTLLRIAAGADPELEPGAAVYMPTTAKAMLADSMRAQEPTGGSAWSRYERWWRERPGISVALGVAMLLIVAGVATAATVVDGWTWWRGILCVVVAANAIGLFAAAGRARRARR